MFGHDFGNLIQLLYRNFSLNIDTVGVFAQLLIEFLEAGGNFIGQRTQVIALFFNIRSDSRSLFNRGIGQRAEFGGFIIQCGNNFVDTADGGFGFEFKRGSFFVDTAADVIQAVEDVVGNAFQFPNLIGNAFFNNIGTGHNFVNFGGKKFSLTAETFAERVILLAERFNMVKNKLALTAQSAVNTADSVVQMSENLFAAFDRFGRNLLKPVALPGKNVGNMGYGFAGFVAVFEQHFIGSGQFGAVAFGNGAESLG